METNLPLDTYHKSHGTVHLDPDNGVCGEPEPSARYCRELYSWTVRSQKAHQCVHNTGPGWARSGRI